MCRPNQTSFQTMVMMTSSDFGSLDSELGEISIMPQPEGMRVPCLESKELMPKQGTTSPKNVILMSPVLLQNLDTPSSTSTSLPSSTPSSSLNSKSLFNLRRKLNINQKVPVLSDFGQNTATYVPALYSPRSGHKLLRMDSQLTKNFMVSPQTQQFRFNDFISLVNCGSPFLKTEPLVSDHDDDSVREQGTQDAMQDTDSDVQSALLQLDPQRSKEAVLNPQFIGLRSMRSDSCHLRVTLSSEQVNEYFARTPQVRRKSIHSKNASNLTPISEQE